MFATERMNTWITIWIDVFVPKYLKTTLVYSWVGGVSFFLTDFRTFV